MNFYSYEEFYAIYLVIFVIEILRSASKGIRTEKIQNEDCHIQHCVFAFNF